MASREQAYVLPAVAAAAALVIWYLWTNQHMAYGITLEQKAFADKSWEPYAWWATHRGEAAWHRNYPTQVGPHCLPTPLQNQDGAVSTSPRSNEESPYG